MSEASAFDNFNGGERLTGAFVTNLADEQQHEHIIFVHGLYLKPPHINSQKVWKFWINLDSGEILQKY